MAHKLFIYSQRASQKRQNHLWYISERLLPMALFSQHVNLCEKESIRKAILKCMNANTSKELMPFSKNIIGKSLVILLDLTIFNLPKTLVKNSCWTFFNLLQNETSLRDLPVAKWPSSKLFLHGKEIVSQITVVNDATEQTLGLATVFN